MDIQRLSSQQLLTKLLSLSLNSPPSPPAPLYRISNTLIAEQMSFELNPTHIDQYNKLYLHRLQVLGKRVPLPKVIKIQEVEERLGVVSIVGIFKRIEVKRVRAFEKEYQDYYSSDRIIYDERDTLQLEDASGKIKLRFTPDVKRNNKPIRVTDLPYGIIIGVTGKNNDQKMQFVVHSITLPTPAPQRPYTAHKIQHPRKTLIMSSPTLSALEHVLKEICQEGSLQIYSTINSVIVMGFSEKLTAPQYREADQLFEKYSRSIDIFVMPNAKQGQIYPQKGLHPILFSKSQDKISLVNNPQIFYPNPHKQLPQQIPYSTLSGSILISSGQNIRDLRKNCSHGQNSLDSMQSLLEYGHLAPTCPFSLKCQMMEEDYLILKEMPNIFVTGGCEKTMDRDWVTGEGVRVRLVALREGDNVLIDIDGHDVNGFRVMEAGANYME